MNQPDHVGLTRRELERELAWMMKRMPEDPRAFVKLMCESFVALLDKNNAAIARALAHREDHQAAPSAHQEAHE